MRNYVHAQEVGGDDKHQTDLRRFQSPRLIKKGVGRSKIMESAMSDRISL